MGFWCISTRAAVASRSPLFAIHTFASSTFQSNNVHRCCGGLEFVRHRLSSQSVRFAAVPAHGSFTEASIIPRNHGKACPITRQPASATVRRTRVRKCAYQFPTFASAIVYIRHWSYLLPRFYGHHAARHIPAKLKEHTQILRTQFESTRALQSPARCAAGTQPGHHELPQSRHHGRRRGILGLRHIRPTGNANSLERPSGLRKLRHTRRR
jgi:hypothetical protein